MRLLNQLPPPNTAVDHQTPVMVHVAVGRSMSKTVILLKWTFQKFGCKEVVLVHVHQPSLTIPTLLGKLPVDRANEALVAQHRKEEKKEMEKMLESYQRFCCKAQVQSKFITTEAGNVQKGVVDMITKYGIHKLVMGATADSCLKVKSISYKSITTAPIFCEMWFVRKGKHQWTREATAGIDETENVLREKVWPSSSQTIINSSCNSEYSRSNSLTTHKHERKPSYLCSKVHDELKLEGFYDQLHEVAMEIKTSKAEAFKELADRKELESIISESLYRAKTCEAAAIEEIKTREHLQNILQTTKMQQEEIIHKNYETMRALRNTNISIALLDFHAKETAHHSAVAARELELIRSSIRSLHERKFKRFNSQARSPNCYMLHGFNNNSVKFIEFSELDIKTATCDFSESFKIEQSGFECVFKGEILNRTVLIKKLHLHNVQGQKEFQQEVNILSKLKHPHLINLIGACPELLSLVYEYLPNGTLRHSLSVKTATPLTWKTRTKIISEISSALLFLHSSKPRRIIHGNLNPDNIFLDSNLNCKIGDFGTCRYVSEDTTIRLLFCQNTEPQGKFCYTDPEYQRTGVLTTKSDVYSLGIIILQMITGKAAKGLVGQVKQAVLYDKLNLILDKSAGEWPGDVVMKLVSFGLQCSEMNVRDRPELMPEVVRELKQLYLMEERHVPHFFLCPILQEIMHDPQVAADGFTYEGSALKEWLDNGRLTSPLTNLELDHINLTPNHALRFAIQDWLCQTCQSG